MINTYNSVRILVIYIIEHHGYIYIYILKKKTDIHWFPQNI
jgi:hypothetical protein